MDLPIWRAPLRDFVDLGVYLGMRVLIVLEKFIFKFI